MSHYDFLSGKYCGKTLPEPVNASFQSLHIMFHSDELEAFKGFKAEWTSTEPPTIKSAAHGKGYFVKDCGLSIFFGLS